MISDHNKTPLKTAHHHLKHSRTYKEAKEQGHKDKDGIRAAEGEQEHRDGGQDDGNVGHH